MMPEEGLVRAAYTGHVPLMFPDYIDLDTGRVLSAEPGGVYDITPASGRSVDEIPGQWFTPADDEAKAEPEPEPEAPAAAFQPDDDED